MKASQGRIAFTAVVVGLTLAALVATAARGGDVLGWLGALAGWSLVLMIRLGWSS